MASNSTSAKQSSRWGSFLQQAVAGVESRLDTILADEDGISDSLTNTKSKGSGTEQPGRVERISKPNIQGSNAEIMRNPSNSRKNDRLQERLAKAVVNRNSTKVGGISASSSAIPSRTGSPSNVAASPRLNVDLSVEEPAPPMNDNDSGHKSRKLQDPIMSDSISTISTNSHSTINVSQEAPMSPSEHWTSSTNSPDSNSIRPSLVVSQEIPVSTSFETTNDKISSLTLEQHEEIVHRIRSDHESAELLHQEETHKYLESIDVLQAKLQYLTKEAAEIAKKAGHEAESGSIEQKLAAKDEKIALLLEEGQKLSQNELKHMNIIRKLRIGSTEDEKRFVQVRKRAEESEKKTILLMQEQAKRAEMAEIGELERMKAFQKVERELEKVKVESESFVGTIKLLHQQLADARASSRVDEAIKYKNLLESEKRLASELRDDLSNLKLEKELSEERHRAQIRNMEEKIEKVKEISKLSEQDSKGELRILESRFEALRARAEEASSGDSSDAQVKLLRQIETLQTQYSIATENWRGIESSLLSRIGGLESERNEATKREIDLRRKLRETGIKSRQVEETLHKTNDELRIVDQKLMEQGKQLAIAQKLLFKAEEDARTTKQELIHERATWEERLAQLLDGPRAESQEYVRATPDPLHQQFGTEPPTLSNRKRSIADKASPHDRRQHGIPGLGFTFTPGSLPDRTLYRRPSGQPSQSSGFGTPFRHESIQSIPRQCINNCIPETPPAYADQSGDFFDEVITPATPDHTINDMISVSTAAAGPSVQLVERMSAAVRRLESEKASSKDEVDRLLAQRDEAREQVIVLMREAEEKRVAEEKLLRLQVEVAEINQRYQTTLEMLGEKSELVEELRADVADVKEMYRDLVQNTMR